MWSRDGGEHCESGLWSVGSVSACMSSELGDCSVVLCCVHFWRRYSYSYFCTNCLCIRFFEKVIHKNKNISQQRVWVNRHRSPVLSAKHVSVQSHACPLWVSLPTADVRHSQELWTTKLLKCRSLCVLCLCQCSPATRLSRSLPCLYTSTPFPLSASYNGRHFAQVLTISVWISAKTYH